jgi:hypothetical protein
MIEIRWQESDRATTASHASTNISAGPTTTASGATSTASHSPSPGLSTGAKAAIGVCVPITAIVAVATAVFLWRRRASSVTTRGQEKQMPIRQELQGIPVAELPSRPAELQSIREPRHELP